MVELATLQLQATILCTLSCAGNRRKEENMVKKTIGFSWGPAGTACSHWTGVRMSHLLSLCGVDNDRDVRFSPMVWTNLLWMDCVGMQGATSQCIDQLPEEPFRRICM